MNTLTEEEAKTERISDADALIAVLAWERCQALASRAKEEVIRDCWRKDAESAWKCVERWLSQEGRS